MYYITIITLRYNDTIQYTNELFTIGARFNCNKFFQKI